MRGHLKIKTVVIKLLDLLKKKGNINMVMAAVNGINITRPEIKFWMAIISLVVLGSVAFANLKSQVNANEVSTQDKGAKLRKEFESDSEILQEVHDSVLILEANQVRLMKNFDLVPIER